MDVFHTDVCSAIREASLDAHGRNAVAYTKGKGWHTYDLKNGCPKGAEPEFFCQRGKVPFPLSDTAFDVLYSALREFIIRKR